MSKRTSVVNISGDYEETMERLALHLGKGSNSVRRQVFNIIYGRGNRPKSKRQIADALGKSGVQAQVVQDALEHLANHHLIEKAENNGVATDGSRWVYGKEEHVRANRDRIVRMADNPERTKRLATKRRPAATAIRSVRDVRKSDLRRRKKLIVLFLTANPAVDSPLRVDAEVRRVQEAIRASKFAESVRVEYRPAADLTTILNGLNDLEPQVVHFSGHGNEAGLLTDTGAVEVDPSDELTYDLLGKALDATDHAPDVLVLNSCSSSGAKDDVLSKVRFLVSMNVPISDIAAAAFAPQFYAALASGQSVQSAFRQGAAAVEATSISESSTPELHCNNADPSKVVLT
ncbi:MAG: CHAT domain-containing protein [Sphingomicrobium sp.]